MAAVNIEIQYDKDRKYFIDVPATIQKAKQELQKQNVKAIKLSGKGGDINRISLTAIQLVEQSKNKLKITSMKSEYNMEKDERDGIDKKHIFLNIVIEKI